MTESGNSEIERSAEKEPIAFGEHLFMARESKGLTIEQVAKAIHLSRDIVDAIERSDVKRLPQPTFVQGYLRAYAKYLGLDDAHILEDYSKAVPHEQETELHPRSTVPDEASSASPFVKSVSISLVLLMLMAAIYGIYNYYSDMLDSRYETGENSALLIPDNGDSMEAMNIRPEIFGQDTDTAESSAPVSELNDPQSNSLGSDSLADDLPQTGVSEVMPESVPTALQVDEVPVQTAETIDVSPQAPIKAPPITLGIDVVELVASEDTWTEVVDASDVGLYYDLVKQNRTVVLKGTAPFNIFLGNAPAMEVKVNGVKIDMTKFVRSNKIAHFTVSTNDQQVVFH